MSESMGMSLLGNTKIDAWKSEDINYKYIYKLVIALNVFLPHPQVKDIYIIYYSINCWAIFVDVQIIKINNYYLSTYF